MENMFQVGFALAGLTQGANQVSNTTTVNAIRNFAETANAQANGKPFVATDIQFDNPSNISEFEVFFETLPGLSSKQLDMPPDQRADPFLGFSTLSPNPEDRVAELETLFQAIENGDLNIDEFIPPGSALSAEIKAALADRKNLAAQQALLTPQGGVPAGDTVFDVVKAQVTTGQNLNAVEAALTPSQSQFLARQDLLNATTPALPSTESGADPAQILPSATHNQPASQTVTTPGDVPTGAVAQGVQVAVSQMIEAKDRIQSAQAVLREAGAGQQSSGLPNNTVQSADTLSSAQAAIARDMGQAQKSDALTGAMERTGSTPDEPRDLPVLRPNPAQFNTAAQQMLQPSPLVTHQTNAASIDSDRIPLDADAPGPELRSLTPVNSATQQGQPTPTTPAQAQQITRQIAMAIQNNANRTVEITLNPAELGRVRISLSSAEAGMVVAIQAERPETLELMRRNADLLTVDFKNIGYEGAAFSFERSDQQDRMDRQFEDPDGTADTQVPILNSEGDRPHTQPTGQTIILDDGSIDIRL